VEFLTVAAPTFQRLKQLPELQQLIAFTATDILHSKELGAPHSWRVAEALNYAWQPDTLGHLPSSIQELVHAVPGSKLQYVKQLKEAGHLSMALLVNPHLCLALVAEVAAAMLCPG
jgi:hypothetical protein